jgi:hypothetical protein
MLEKEVEEAVWRYADKLGCIAIKLNGPMDRGKPDRVFFYRGRALIVEFKKPGGKPTELQKSWLERFEKNGFTTHIVDKIGEGKTLIDQFVARTDAEVERNQLFDDL